MNSVGLKDTGQQADWSQGSLRLGLDDGLHHGRGGVHVLQASIALRRTRGWRRWRRSKTAWLVLPVASETVTVCAATMVRCSNNDDVVAGDAAERRAWSSERENRPSLERVQRVDFLLKEGFAVLGRASKAGAASVL